MNLKKSIEKAWAIDKVAFQGNVKKEDQNDTIQRFMD